jgi:hypothetical protein
MLAYVLEGQRTDTFKDTNLMMVMMIMTILTNMAAKCKESRVLYSSNNDASILNSTPGMEKFVDCV